MRRTLLVAALALLTLPAGAGAVTIQEFPLAPGAAPFYLKPGPDGNLWVVDKAGTGAIRRVSMAGAALPPVPATSPQDIAVGPSGNVYWSETGVGNGGAGAVVRLTPGGVRATQSLANLFAYAIVVGPNERVTVSGRFQGSAYADSAGVCLATFSPTASCTNVGPILARPTSLVYAADGRMWGVMNETSQLQQFQTDPLDAAPGTSAVVNLPGGSLPTRAVQGPDGNLWITMTGANAIERIIVSPFERTRFTLQGAGKAPTDIAVGPDGALWFTESGGNAIGRITTSGEITEFPVPTPGARPTGITAGPDGNIWFTENATGAVGRLAFDTPNSPASGGGGATVVADHAAPRFTRGLRRTRRAIQFSLSEPARVALTVERRGTGRRVNGRCVRSTARTRRRPRCTRWSPVATLQVAGRQNANSVSFTRRLRRGTYRLRAVATDAAGNKSAPSRATFTVSG